MRQYKIIARILLILPIISVAFALPIVQETCQLCGDVVPDPVPVMTMSAKRGVGGEKQSDESLSGKPGSLSATPPPSGSAQLESDPGSMNEHALPQNPTLSAAPDYGSMDPIQAGTGEIQEVSPELTNSPSLNRWLPSPESSASFASVNSDGYLGSSESGRSVAPVVPVDSDDHPVSSLSMEKPRSKSFLSKVFGKFKKIKFWRRNSRPGPVRDVVNATQRELQGLVNTGAYVSASSLESQTFYL
jgi:hypothetical protein